VQPVIIVLIILVVLAFIALIKTIQVIPQASAAIVERFGRYTRTLNAGLNIVVPFIDTIRNRIDLREQVVPFPPQPVITQDNLVVNIDTVIYYQVTDARAATYEVASYIQAIEQLTVTTLRNIIGSMDLESTLTSRETINAGLRGVLDEATGKWGILHPGLDGEADARRPGQARGDPHRRRRPAGVDPHRRGPEAGRGAQGRGPGPGGGAARGR
jgi:regulator of protease activity HflC (stomatin/prohibitin superfamily)